MMLSSALTTFVAVPSTPQVNQPDLPSQPTKQVSVFMLIHDTVCFQLEALADSYVSPGIICVSVEFIAHCRITESCSNLLCFLYSTLLFHALLYSTALYSTLLYCTLLYSTLLYSTLLCSTLLCSTLLCSVGKGVVGYECALWVLCGASECSAKGSARHLRPWGWR